MASEKLTLDLEFAILEQNADLVNALFQELKIEGDSEETSTLIAQLKDLVICLCHGNYLAALQNPAVQELFGFSCDSESNEEFDVYIKRRLKEYLLNENNNHLSSLRQLLVLSVSIACLQIFVQQNWTGPLLDPKTIEYLPEKYNSQYKNGSLQVLALERISNGENLYSKLNSTVELLIADIILVEELGALTSLKSSYIWSFRCLTLKHRVMDEHSNTIINEAFKLIKLIESSPFMSIEKNRSIACQLNLEIGHFYIQCYEMIKAKEHFDTAQDALGMKFNLSGALGKRTKFQEDFIAQLKLDVHRDDLGQNPDDNHQAIDIKHFPKNVFLDDDLVLDKISFKDDAQDMGELVLNPLEMTLILSFCILSQKSQAVHSLTTEELITYIETVVRRPMSWIVHTVALHMRSRLEKGSSRKVERSMMQLEVLVNAVKHLEPQVHVRHLLFYCLPLRPKWIMQDDFAQVLMSLGSIKSALDIYQDLEMWENVIGCLQSLGRYEKAEKLIKDQLKEKETPRLWCLLGDVTKDESCYEKAWELSKHRSARAQRSLGLLHLRSQHHAASIPCFQASLEINALQEDIWFSMGCAAMAVKDWELAKKAFHRCVALEPNNSKAWNNLANVCVHLNDRTKAHAALKEALRSEFNNWQMWENYLVISAQIGSYYDCIFAFHQLMDIKDKYKDVQILGLVVRAVCEGKEDNKGKSAARLRPELLKLMGRITSQIANDSNIWSLYSKLYLVTDSLEDKEKGLSFLIKAHRLTSQASNWESDVEKFKEVIELAILLTEVSREVSKNKATSQEAIQVLSSAKLIMKQLITKAEKHHTNTLTGQLTTDIAEKVNELKTNLSEILETIEKLRTSSS